MASENELIRPEWPVPADSRLMLPASPRGFVDRPRLEAILDAGVLGPLTLVSAPAGMGKTALVAAWARRRTGVRWVALDDAKTADAALRWLGVALRCDGELMADGVPSVLAEAAPVVVVLDCDAAFPREVGQELDRLLRRCQQWLHLVVISRADPLLALHAYRVAGTITEIRAAELAFRAPEAGNLLAAAGLHLSSGAVTAVTERTQGWAAGLRLAALALAGRADAEQAVRDFHGDTGVVAEYLLAEMLESQPEGTRNLLLDTSILDVLEPGLVAALAEAGRGRPGAQAQRELAALAKGNVLMEDVAERTGCYRYYGLFRELLLAQLALEAPARIPHLHAAAARWLAWEGRSGEALSHARRAGPEPPNDLVAELRALARARGRADGRGVLRAVGAMRSRLDGEGVAHDAAAGGQEHPGLRAFVHEAAGMGWLWCGNAPRAAGEFTACLKVARAGRLGDAGTTLISAALSRLALIAALRTELRRARDLAVQALQAGPRVVADRPVADCAAHAALAWVDMESYNLAAARQHLQQAHHAQHVQDADTDSAASDPLIDTVLAIVASRLCRAHGDLHGALLTLDDVPARDGRSLRRPRWMQNLLSVEREALTAASSPHTSSPHASGSPRPVTSPTGGAQADDHFAGAAAVVDQEGAPLAVRVEDYLRAASRHLGRRERTAAAQAVAAALHLAAPEGYRRPFRQAPADVRALLRQDAELHAVRRVIEPALSLQSAAAWEIQPLTAKEREVLGHLAELESTQEIAGAMFVSINTVRTHVRNILRKLAVSRRNEAVRRARQLNLLEPVETGGPITLSG